jgi:hypothetical protein
MKVWTRIAFVLLFVPLVASAQFRSLDAAMDNLERGFGGGHVDAIVSGIGANDQVKLQFPEIEKDGFFGRDQARYLLDGLFNQTKPSGFERVSVRGQRAEGQHHIKARWTIADGTRDLYITLQQKDDGRWAVASVRSGGN